MKGGTWILILILIAFFIAFNSDILSFVGVNKQIAYFGTDSNPNNYATFNLEFVNPNQLDEFESVNLVFINQPMQVREFGLATYLHNGGVFDYVHRYCVINHNIRDVSSCCQANGYVKDYKSDGNTDRCYNYRNVNANLVSLSVAEQNVALTSENLEWHSIDFANIINNYCPNHYTSSQCLVPIKLTNNNADGSGVNINLNYALRNVGETPTNATDIDVEPSTESNNSPSPTSVQITEPTKANVEIVVDETISTPSVNAKKENFLNLIIDFFKDILQKFGLY